MLFVFARAYADLHIRPVCPAELQGRAAKLRLEAANKVACVLEAAGGRHIADGLLGVHQQMLGQGETALRDVLHGAHAHRLPEMPRQAAKADMMTIGQLGQGQFLRKALIQLIQDGSDTDEQEECSAANMSGWSS